MTATPTLEFSNDRPLSSKTDDKLNRAPFAERVAGVLLELPRAPAFRKDDTPLNRKPGGLMEQSNASLQRGDQG